MWLGIGIALLCIGMAAWPIMQLIPSERQKEIIAIRQLAMRLGFKVEIKQPDLPKALEQQFIFSGKALYLIAQKQKQLNHTPLLALRSKHSGEWFWLENNPPARLIEPLQKAYQKLPDSIFAVEHQSYGTGVYFNERGDEAALEQLKQTIIQINKVSG